MASKTIVILGGGVGEETTQVRALVALDRHAQRAVALVGAQRGDVDAGA